MDKKQLQDILSQTYNQENWKNIIRFVFPNVSILATPKEFPIKNDKIKSFKQLGSVHLNDGKNLALFELLLYDSVNIHRNRVELNNEISRYIDQEQIHGVLSVFEQGTEDYRFTFSARSTEFDEKESDFVLRKTDNKRYTYVLGKNESCKTPAERFFNLSEKKYDINIDSIQNAFSVEQLSKEFFDKYKKQFEKFYTYIALNEKYSEISFGIEREKGVRDFVKQLLGRIVFLYFLQKKGWMGCEPKEVGWTGGDKQFMQNLFDDYSNVSFFHSKCLSDLFYNTLNKKRIDDIFPCEGLSGGLNNSKVPYLNGGLFDSNEDISRKIDFPVNFFQELFDFFGQYNFTIDENEPNDHEVGIAPEMLGHIFENLLEDNKDKGAFYTPKEIVHYMCQESLIEYLCTSLNIEPEDQERFAISKLLKQKVVEEILKPEIENIHSALDKVKICDPAIGSGAFPMGLLHEIFSAKQTLHTFEFGNFKTFDASAVKLNIIQNSIYGVDIEKGAVEIARLRFWLSLIVDEEIPKPLPNLDYKIVVGNSLISKIGDEIIDIDWTLDETSHGLFGADLAQQKSILLKKIIEEQKDYFNPDCDKKKYASNIRRLKIELLITQLELMVKTQGIENKPNGTSKSTSKQTEIYFKTICWKNIIKDLHYLSDKPELPLEFFDWKLDFPEVMNKSINVKTGFDIVIGNPPYFEISEPTLKNRFQNQFKEVLSGHYDIYIFFFKISLDLISEKGILSFITPHTFLHYTQYSALRRYIYENTRILEITDRLPNIFENAIVDTSISILTKSINSNVSKFSIKQILNGNVLDKDYLLIDKLNFSDSTFDITAIRKLNELNRYSTNTVPLGNIVNSSQGITVYAKVQGAKINYFRDNELEKHSKKYLKGRDFNKYQNNWINSYIIYGKHLWCRRDSKFFEEPKIFVRQTSDSIIATYVEEPFYAIDSVHSLISKNESFNLKYILSILNSRLGDYLFHLLINEDGKVFAQVKLTFLRRIPIKISNNKIQFTFIDKVDSILKLKSENKDASALERQIDNLVYKLYGLSYEEVKFVEPEFGLSEIEYDSLQLS